MSETSPHPDANLIALEALAAGFEAAFQAQLPFFYGSGTDEEADAATARVNEIARKIVALPTTDMEIMGLKARIYLWSEATDFKTFAAKNEGDGSSEAVPTMGSGLRRFSATRRSRENLLRRLRRRQVDSIHYIATPLRRRQAEPPATRASRREAA
jgi:hypothetical protein